MGLLQVVVYTSASKLEGHSQSERENANSPNVAVSEASGDGQTGPPLQPESDQGDKPVNGESSTSDGKRSTDTYNIFLKLPESDLHNLCSLLGREGYNYSLILIFACFECCDFR